MNMKKLIDYTMEQLRIYRRKTFVKNKHKRFFKDLEKTGIEIKRLSNEQKKQVDAIYKKYGVKYTYKTHELVYSVTGEFIPDILPEDVFRTDIEVYLNDYDSKYVLTDKNYFDIFMPTIKFPYTVVRNIEGNLYDHEYNLITEEKAKGIIDAYDKVVYKPSLDSGFGRGVALVNTKEENPLTFGKKNYIIQEVLSQHPEISALNESSVNVIRVETVMIDGEVYDLTAAIRIGGVGAFADNVKTKDGRGMIIIGIDENGKLREKGYYSCGDFTTQTPGGIKFLGYEVPKYKEIVETAKKAHTLFPRLGFIAWDFCVNAEGEVICMEYNARGPGVLFYQYCNGGLLGEHADKVFEYVKKEKARRKLF